MADNALLRRGGLMVWDIICWTLGAAFVIGLRYSFRISEVQSEAVLRYLVTSWILLIAIGLLTKFYRGRFLVGSFDEALGLALHVFVVAFVALLARPVLYPGLPRSIPVL